MNKLNGFNYSLNQPSEYKFRAKFEYQIVGHGYTRNFDIYTDNPNRNDVEQIFIGIVNDKIPNIDTSKSKIVHWTTKEQDDINAALIDEFINPT